MRRVGWARISSLRCGHSDARRARLRTGGRLQMTITPRTRLWGLWALMHPGPSLITVAVYVLCAFVAAGGRPAPSCLVLTTLGLVCMQFAISALNDYCDREADRRNGKKRKPLVLGLVSPAGAIGVTVALTLAMFALFAP